ncbi:MAG: ComEC/Rec2 family competence protein [Acidobacteriota bacterium]|nr:ComEC/Rec2 family competence protein [Blastocatellia bacterium]MDW8412746.1 ComEC/Rec2 family competence protein [Acidobacteriota bacterium]
MFIRRPMLSITVAYLAGTAVAGNYLSATYLFCCAVIGGLLALFCYLRKSSMTDIAIYLSIAVAASANLRAEEQRRLVIRPDSKAEAYGEVCKSLPAPDGYVIEVALDYLHFEKKTLKCNGQLLRLRCYTAFGPRLGDRIRAVFTPTTREYRNPGMPSTGVLLTGTVSSDRHVELLYTGGSLKYLLDGLSCYLRAAISRLPQQASSVLEAVILGNRYYLEESLVRAFKDAGTYHTLVISGSHIALLVMILGWFCRSSNFGLLLLLAAVWTYALVTGCDTPVVRAAVMATAMLAGMAARRRVDSANSLSVAIFVILVVSPRSIFELGFQMTAIAVAALVLIVDPLLLHLERIGKWMPSAATPYPPLCSRLVKWFAEVLYWQERKLIARQAEHGLKYGLRKARLALVLEKCGLQLPVRYFCCGVLATFVVQLALLPIFTNTLHKLSPSILLTNVFAELSLALLLATLILFILAAVLGVDLSWLMCSAVGMYVDVSTIQICRSFRTPSLSEAATGFLFMALLLTVVLLWKWQPLAERKQGLPALLIVAIAVLLLLAVVFGSRSEVATEGLRADFLDVAHGDCILIRFPDATKMLVDGGGSIGRFDIGEEVVSRYLWYEGITCLDYVVATHADLDHAGGLEAVIENFTVRRLVLPVRPGTVSGFRRLEEAAARKGVPIEVWQKGVHKTFGRAECAVLWPTPEFADGENNASLVLSISHGGHKILLTGDIEAVAESRLLTEGLTTHTVLKVAHHGSKTSTSLAFLQAVRPQLAVISADRYSRFGHPHEEVLSRLECSTYITGRDGMVSIDIDTSLRVRCYVDRYS